MASPGPTEQPSAEPVFCGRCGALIEAVTMRLIIDARPRKLRQPPGTPVDLWVAVDRTSTLAPYDCTIPRQPHEPRTRTTT